MQLLLKYLFIFPLQFAKNYTPLFPPIISLSFLYEVFLYYNIHDLILLMKCVLPFMKELHISIMPLF
jgi:hypothetical protein